MVTARHFNTDNVRKASKKSSSKVGSLNGAPHRCHLVHMDLLVFEIIENPFFYHKKMLFQENDVGCFT
jgi:hypothetical protein